MGWGGAGSLSSVVWPMVSSQHCGNTPTPWLTQEALIKLSGQLKQNPEEEELKRGVGAGGKVKTQTKQPGGLSHSSADMLTHFILLRGPATWRQLHRPSPPPQVSWKVSGCVRPDSSPLSHRRLTGFFLLPSRTAVNAQTGVCTPAGGLVTGKPHPLPFFTLGA